MKVSNKKLDLVDNIIEDWKLNLYDSKEIMFDLLREYLQTKTIAYLQELSGYVEENEIN
jgi:hypothetical protein